MTSSPTEISETPKFKSASLNIIEGQAASLAGTCSTVRYYCYDSDVLQELLRHHDHNYLSMSIIVGIEVVDIVLHGRS